MTMELLNDKIIQKPLTSHKFSSKFIFTMHLLIGHMLHN